MKPETVDALRKLNVICSSLLTDDPPTPGCSLTEMQVLLRRAQEHEANSTVGDTNLVEEEVERLREGRHIDAIKMVRARTGLPLRESREVVETAGIKLGFRTFDPSGIYVWRWTTLK